MGLFDSVISAVTAQVQQQAGFDQMLNPGFWTIGANAARSD
jgi:hypothetical protein